MFVSECGGCGAGLRARDEKCRQCNRTVTRSAAGSAVRSFADSPPRAVVAPPAAAAVATLDPCEDSDLALASAPPTERRKSKTEKSPKVSRTRKGAEPPLLVDNAVPLIEAELQTATEGEGPEVASAAETTEAESLASPTPEAPVVDIDLPALVAADAEELLA